MEVRPWMSAKSYPSEMSLLYLPPRLSWLHNPPIVGRGPHRYHVRRSWGETELAGRGGERGKMFAKDKIRLRRERKKDSERASISQNGLLCRKETCLFVVVALVFPVNLLGEQRHWPQ